MIACLIRALPKGLLIVALLTYGSFASCGLGLVLLALWAPLSPVKFVRERLLGLSGYAAGVGFAYGFLVPVAGLMMMASSTMYGNVKNYGGTNHMIVPTGLLQSFFAEGTLADLKLGLPHLEARLAGSSAAAWLADGFGGGYVRIEHTNGSAFKQLAVHGADVTEQLPPRARQLLQQVNASGFYFEFYAARNYFDRKHDIEACSLNALSAEGAGPKQDPPYARAPTVDH